MKSPLGPGAEDVIARAVRIIAQNKWLAHQQFFAHRHPVNDAIFHPELVEDFWSDDQYSQVLGFRGSAKSTFGEEDIALAVCLRTFRNIVIMAASETRAAERLASVAYELDNNEALLGIFGMQRGAKWTQTKIVTPWGCVQALGRDQDIRGIKHLEWRPDFIFVDDFEDKDNVQTPEGRIKTLRWFLSELLPACAPSRKVRVRATPMDAESVPMLLAKLRDREGRHIWRTRTFPIEIRNETTGLREPTWPAQYPIEWIDRERRMYQGLGQLDIWAREYMCEAVSDQSRTFTETMIRVRPQVRTWQAVWVMYDPARSRTAQSATTGKAVWSWIGNRLVVWESSGERWLPNELVADIFKTDEKFQPVKIGVEQDGLQQWLMQPLRIEAARRRRILPIEPRAALAATRGLGKHAFIRGLQPLFLSGMIEFAEEQPELRAQLLSYPRGDIDIPNALAYALVMKPGAPIYEDFGNINIDGDLRVDYARPLYLVANATASLTAAALVQNWGGSLRVIADWLREGDPAQTVGEIQYEAGVWASGSQALSWIIPRRHRDRYTNVGLDQAIRAIPAIPQLGGAEEKGRDHIRTELSRIHRGEPGIVVAENARWVLNGFAGGYCRALSRNGVLLPEAEEGAYRLMLEAIEAFAGLMYSGRDESDEDLAQPVSYDRNGKPYRSAMPARG